MSEFQFDDIMQAFSFTNELQPQYNDYFHDVCQMIETFKNHHMVHYTLD